MERVSIFIDGNNLYHGLKGSFGKSQIDFKKFIARLIKGRKLIRTYYYNATISAEREPKRAKEQQKFFSKLNRLEYFDIRLGRLEPRGETFVEKGVDVAIAVDMLALAVRDTYDTAVLVSSDGDFAKAVGAVQDTGKHVEIACFRKAYHLKQCADRVIELDEKFLKTLWSG